MHLAAMALPVRKNISENEYDDRVVYGKSIEKLILDKLSNQFTIAEATDEEDIYDKIDGYIVGKDDTYTPLQIKYRETGDDIIFEVAFMDKYNKKDTIVPREISSHTLNGRDMIGHSSVYACLSQDGCSIWMCETQAIKNKAKAMAMRLYEQFLSTKRTSYKDPYGEVRITTDRSTGIRKIMFFAKPSTFAKRTVTLHKSLWTT
jgi:hypothetical protein